MDIGHSDSGAKTKTVDLTDDRPVLFFREENKKTNRFRTKEKKCVFQGGGGARYLGIPSIFFELATG